MIRNLLFSADSLELYLSLAQIAIYLNKPEKSAIQHAGGWPIAERGRPASPIEHGSYCSDTGNASG
jgi:hypothetical protein